jgi:hypothetical protein
MQMTEEAKAKLRGRPRNTTRIHEYGTATERSQWQTRLDGAKHSRGLNMLKRYYSGVLLTPRQAIAGMCCECLGYYADRGAMADCESKRCPLYHYMPYRKKVAQ